MTRPDRRPLAILLAGALLFSLAACAGGGHSQTPPPRTQPTEPRLLAEEYVEGEAVVQAINKTDRTVTLRNAAGQSSTINVPADVDLNRLKVGDTVALGGFQSLSLRVLPPGSAPLGATVTTGSTAPGQPQGRAWGQQLVVVTQVTQVDLAANTVTLVGADGQSRVVEVRNPDMQARLKNLQVGDLVEITYAEVVAAKVIPKSR
jgi:hypothetical protein